jgi:hypothetical protein
MDLFMSASEEPEGEALDVKAMSGGELQQYVWGWFALHSAQRMQLVNFWLLSTAFLVTAYVGAVSTKNFVVAIGVSLAGVATSIGFCQLDIRTRQLVRVAEMALARLDRQRGLAHELRLVARGHEIRHHWYESYRVVIRSLQLVIALLFACALIYSIHSLS